MLFNVKAFRNYSNIKAYVIVAFRLEIQNYFPRFRIYCFAKGDNKQKIICRPWQSNKCKTSGNYVEFLTEEQQ